MTTMTTWLLVHSPLLGPASWSAVAAQLWDVGDTVVVPDLRPALSGGAAYAERQAELAAAAAPQARCVTLAGHSGAGPLLPVVAAALAQRGIAVERAVFVDAGLPHPGRSRRSTLPDELASHLDTLTSDGWLPPWPRWWPPEALTELLPDPELRETLQQDSPSLPAQLFTEMLPHGAALPAAGYLLLSEPYAEAADEAEAAGWPVVRLSADHLAPLSRPGVVAAALREVAAQTSARFN